MQIRVLMQISISDAAVWSGGVAEGLAIFAVPSHCCTCQFDILFCVCMHLKKFPCQGESGVPSTAHQILAQSRDKFKVLQCVIQACQARPPKCWEGQKIPSPNNTSEQISELPTKRRPDNGGLLRGVVLLQASSWPLHGQRCAAATCLVPKVLTRTMTAGHVHDDADGRMP